MLTPWLGILYLCPVNSSHSFSSVAQSCPSLCDPMDCNTPGFHVITNSQGLPKRMSIDSVMPSKHLILCPPLLLPPSIFPSIRVFSSESALHIRWPKYWSLSFNISPYNEHSGLFRLVITFLPRSKLLISWLQSPSAVILEPPQIKSDTFPIYLP